MSSSGSITPSEAFGGKLLPDPEIDTLPGTLAVAHRFAGHGLPAWLACACRPRRVAHRFAGHDGRDGRDWRHQRTGLERHYLSNGS